MKIIGIDPGSARCGWAVIDKNNNKLQLIGCGCIVTLPKFQESDRLLQLYYELCAVIDKYQPEEMAIEELFFVKNVKTGITVGQARGVILMCAAQKNLKITNYKPNVIKNTIVGYGHADKIQVQNMVKLELRLKEPITQDDTADAVAVALCHLNHFNHANITRITPESKLPKKIKLRKDRPKILFPELSYKVVGVLHKVSNESGFILHERHYYPIIEKLFNEYDIEFVRQVPVNLKIMGRNYRYYLDYLIEDRIALEIKVGVRYTKQDVDQLMEYLRSTGKQLGILARFTRAGVDTKRFLLGRNSIRVKFAHHSGD